MLLLLLTSCACPADDWAGSFPILIINMFRKICWLLVVPPLLLGVLAGADRTPDDVAPIVKRAVAALVEAR